MGMLLLMNKISTYPNKSVRHEYLMVITKL